MRYFFFFQAEDGIRDGTVTGVQTCALPISARDLSPVRAADDPARPPGLPLDRPGDVPSRRRGPPTVGALRAFRRPGPGRRAGAAEVGAQNRRETQRTRPARAL